MSTADRMPPCAVPRATYRLQLNREFRFGDAKAILTYLSRLGISHLYLSPILKARPGSSHGYDVIDHAAVNPELGTYEEFVDLALTARAHGLGILLDIVPNHMAVLCNENAWWMDVLEHGPAAASAASFDIDWHPWRAALRDRVLVPLLERAFGEELREGKITLALDSEQGKITVRYGEHRLPIDPKEYARILDRAVQLQEAVARSPMLRDLSAEFAALPPRHQVDAPAVERRYVRSAELHRRLAELCRSVPAIKQSVERAIMSFNDSTDPTTLDALADLLEAQPYRLAFWKVAGHEINYRRFFDVNQLAGLRASNPRVFNATHDLVLRLFGERLVDGFRIDHVDGIDDPLAYLSLLQQASIARSGARPYTVVEKILASHERLREDWPIDGTTGYEFGAAVCSWMADGKGLALLEQTYRQLTRQTIDYAELAMECKRLLMRTSLAAELSMLAMQLDRIAQMHRDTRDFTYSSLRDAIAEVIAAFPVYRTYVTAAPGADDKRIIHWAIGLAQTHNPILECALFDFIEAVLTKSLLTESDPREPAIQAFVTRFQQVTPAVTAKALEDTFFYRYCRLLAANEVGSDPRTEQISSAALLKTLSDRAARWPLGLLGTSTHDSKRGEDVRYRLLVLSEQPKLWRQFFVRAGQLNRSSRVRSSGQRMPSRNDEYLLLQTLIGMWPCETFESDLVAHLESTLHRLGEYAVKALREAKQHTSWIQPNVEYEDACQKYIEGFASAARRPLFLTLLKETLPTVAYFGALNSLSATTLKLTAAGVPDLYQGSEFTELTLVDPDNRKPVDFESRLAFLERHARAESRFRPFDTSSRSSEVKFHVVRSLLQLRASHVDLFAQGTFEPLSVFGLRSEHVCAYLRRHGRQVCVVMVTRWMAKLCRGDPRQIDASLWADTYVALPSDFETCNMTNMFDSRLILCRSNGSGWTLLLSDVLIDWPTAVLTNRTEEGAIA